MKYLFFIFFTGCSLISDPKFDQEIIEVVETVVKDEL